MREIGDDNFYREAIDSDTPSLIFISKEDAPGHKELVSILEELEKEYGDCVNFYYMDASRNTTPKDFGIDTFPAIVYFRETMEVDRHIYIPSRENIVSVLKRLCSRG